MRCFRVNPADEDPRRLLGEDAHWTEPWGSSGDGADCDKCRAVGKTHHECWSCVLTGARPQCPVCSGKVRWEDVCPVCRGSGKVDGGPRHGVSVFPTEEGLYHYILATEAKLDGSVVVELEASPSDDVDFDADQGAMLVIPTAVREARPADFELLEHVRRRRVEAA